MSTGNQSNGITILVAIIGAIAVLGAAVINSWDKIFPKQPVAPIPVTVTVVAPSLPVQLVPSTMATPSPSVQSQPNIISSVPKYELAQGEWRIIENVKLEQGGYRIVWKYNSNILDGNLRMKGRKIAVNHKESTIGEKQAISVYNLMFKGHKAEGEFEEINYKNEILRGVVKITFDKNLESFSGSLYQDGKEVSTLYGTRPYP
jgi:hypothetical protein